MGVLMREYSGVLGLGGRKCLSFMRLGRCDLPLMEPRYGSSLRKKVCCWAVWSSSSSEVSETGE